MVIMASGIARGRVRTTTTTTTTATAELPNMAAILQLIGRQRLAPSARFVFEESHLFLVGFFKKKRLISICYVDKR